MTVGETKSKGPEFSMDFDGKGGSDGTEEVFGRNVIWILCFSNAIDSGPAIEIYLSSTESE